jgi:hypothetical protein
MVTAPLSGRGPRAEGGIAHPRGLALCGAKAAKGALAIQPEAPTLVYPLSMPRPCSLWLDWMAAGGPLGASWPRAAQRQLSGTCQL